MKFYIPEHFFMFEQGLLPIWWKREGWQKAPESASQLLHDQRFKKNYGCPVEKRKNPPDFDDFAVVPARFAATLRLHWNPLAVLDQIWGNNYLKKNFSFLDV